MRDPPRLRRFGGFSLADRYSAIGFLFGLTAIATPVLAGERQAEFAAQPYRAASDWQLSHNSYACTTQRHFERDGERISLTMRRVHPGAGIQFGMFGTKVEWGKEPVTAGFVPSEAYGYYQELASASLGQAQGYAFAGPAYLETALAISEGEAPEKVQAKYGQLAENTTHFFVSGLTEEPVALETGAMTSTFEQLDECVMQRLAEMGITKEVQLSTSSFPKPVDGDAWSKEIAKIYPREALQNGFDGLVEMRVIVGADGSPEHCHVANEMIALALREAACGAMLEHSRFEPARNAAGEAIPGLYFQNVHYKFPPQVDAHGMLVRGE